VVVKDEPLTFDVIIVEVEAGVVEDAVFGGVYFKSSTESEPTCVVTSRVSGKSVGTQAQSMDAPLSNFPWCTFGFELGLRPTAG